MTLREQLKGAQIIMTDDARALTLVWFGGHGIHAYNDDGVEVSFWNTGNFQHNDATPRAVRASMRDAIEEGGYP